MLPTPFAPLNGICVKSFGSLVTYQPTARPSFQVNGILQKKTDEERDLDAAYARLFINLADFATPPVQGDEAAVDGKTYKVFKVLTDSALGAWLALRES